MNCPIGPEALAQLKQFIDICSTNPAILNIPALNFFKTFVESLGGKIPPSPSPEPKMPTETPSPTEDAPQADSEPESDLELDTEGCVEPDEPNPDQKMGDPDKEVAEAEADGSDERRSAAVGQFGEGNFAQAVELLTEAIELNPHSALQFAKRGQAFLKLAKPNACIKDCTRALELNPDSAAAYKFRGRAYRLLGEWEKAAKDLRQACNIDLDEQADEWLKEVTPNAKKIESHNLKRERRRLEREERERLERARQAREAHARAAAGAKAPEEAPPTGGSDFFKLLQDPEMMQAFQDPEVAAAFTDISSNPGNFYKYQSNPKVMALITKLSGKFSGAGLGAGGFPGFPGGMPGFGGAAGAGAAPPNFSQTDDDNLD